MKEYVITTFLLLFNLCEINGHTLANIQQNNITDVYEVKDQSSLSITHPKDDKPTLREIVYFHVIERPYDSGYDKVANKTPGIDSKRSFTNGHGYQYIQEDNEVIDEPESEEGIADSERPNEERQDDDDNERDEAGSTTDIKSTDKPDGTEDAPEDNNKNDDGEANFHNNEETRTVDADVNKKIPKDDGLNVRFSEDIAVEELGTQYNPVNRKKRQIDYTNLPDAPSLPEFKLDILPDYIKSILLEPDSPEKPKLAENLEEIEEQVRNLEKAVNHPPSVENSRKREARTYGMSLAGDRGEVWNDINAGHLSYHVGEPETATSTSKPEETPKTTIATTTSASNESTEQISLNEDDKSKDIEESFDEVVKILTEVIKEAENELIGNIQTNATMKPDHENDTTKVTTEMTTIKTTIETTSIKPTTESVNENTGCGDKASTEKPNEKPGDKKDSKDRKDNKETTKDNDENSKQKDFVKELMKNKYFWQWLQDSSAAYLEIMMKKVDVLIKAEVKKQIKQYFKEHQNVTNFNQDGNNTAQITTQHPNVNGTSNGTDVLEITTENPIVNELNTTSNNNKTDEPIKNYNETEEELSKKHNKKELDDKNKNAPIKIEAQHVYGSSVNNEKVTNIFIFNIGKESDLANIKPLQNGTNGVFVFGLDKTPDQEKADEDHKGDNKTEIGKDIADNPGATVLNTNDKESEKNTPGINQVSTAKPETESVTDGPKENITEDSSSETEATKTEKQTTPKEPSDYSTQKPNIDTELSTSTTENTIESTTDAQLIPSIDETTTSFTEITTESTESSKEVSKDEIEIETEKLTESDSTTSSDIEPKPTDTSNTNKSNAESDNDKTEQKETDITENTKVNTDDTTDTENENTTEKDE